jgi:cell division protein FtsA
MNIKDEIKDELIFSLDIGTRTIIGIVGEYDENEQFKVLAYTLKEHKKRNMYDGQIHDIDEVAKTVKEIVKELEGKVGKSLKVVSIAAAGRALKTHRISLEQTIDNTKEISKYNIETLELEAIQKAQEEINKVDINKNLKYYSIGYTVIDYYLDESRMEKLEGHRGDRIGVELLATFLPQIVIEGLYSVISRVGLEVGSITLEPIAAINVAIKPELRLLNLALVDIGAGTSDIAITKDGQIISYGMTSTAGDEITERLAKAYLLDFNNSEKLKIELSKKEEQEFTDILGITHKTSTKEIVNNIIDIVEIIAKDITDKILEYNTKSPNAVFLIGGSSQMPMLKEIIAENLGLPKERVSIRDTSFIENIEGLGDGNGPDMITPIGIAIEGAQNKYRNFISLNFNGEEIRMFNTEDIKVSDVLIMTGYNPRDLMPKRTEDFIYYINGKKRSVKGKESVHPQILVNNEHANLRTKLTDKDIIKIIPGIAEDLTLPYLYDLVLNTKSIHINGKELNIIKTIKVNGNIIKDDILLKQEDNIEIEEIKTINELKLEYDNYKYSRFMINGNSVEDNYILKNGDKIFTKDNIGLENININKKIKLVINGTEMEIPYTKDKFIFVDIFDYINFDLSSLNGKLVLSVNEREAEYMEELKDGDNIRIYWE